MAFSAAIGRTSTLPQLEVSALNLRLYALMYLLTIKHQNKVFITDILHDLGLPNEYDQRLRGQYYLVYKRLLGRLKSDWQMQVEYITHLRKNIINADKLDPKLTCLKEIKIIDYGIINKKELNKLLTLYKDFFEANLKEIIQGKI